jgi:hypothetical protein
MDNLYNYVIVGKVLDLYEYTLADLKECEYVLFDESFSEPKLKYFWDRAYWSQKVNHVVKMPFKKRWVARKAQRIADMVPKFKEQKELCIVLFSVCVPWEEYGFSAYLKKLCPKCKIVYYFNDLIDISTSRKQFVSQKPQSVDGFYTYDKVEAQKYGIDFYPSPCSRMDKLVDKEEIIYDICFVGMAKNRWKDIYKAYHILTEKGFHCLFCVIDLPKNAEKIDGIRYCKRIPYLEYLKMIRQSKVILDIIQKGSHGNSMRIFEAILFDKYLLSNNPYLMDDDLYNDQFMKVYSDIESVDKTVLDISVKYENKDELSPFLFLERLEKDMQMQDGIK